jgi:hypothetical protein
VAAFSDAQGFQAAFLERQWATAVSFDSMVMGADKYVATATATTAPTWSANSATWVGISTALRPLVIVEGDVVALIADTALPFS